MRPYSYSRTKTILFYLSFCLLVSFLACATQALVFYGKTLIALNILYLISTLIIPKFFPSIKTWQYYLTLAPFLLVVVLIAFRMEDLPNIISAIASITLGILLLKGNFGHLVKAGISLVWAVAIIWAAFNYLPNREIKNRVTTLNKSVPDFRLVDDKGNEFSTKKWKGKVVLVDMWYTKCGACLKQLRSTQELYNRFKSRPDVLICAVNAGYDSLNQMNALTSRYPYNFPYYLDQDTSIAKTLNFEDFPRTLVIDKSGKIRYHVEGFSKEWEAEYKDKMITVIDGLAKE